ncbi:MAG: cytochrome ubiquinol oxidase subunit I [Prevotellaceae bacterium]|jgi:cytochrome d ubiquinol oxidase subunit I|nr:cytochrome ubiquinol oxidase subunit I [Prevotellaceae bacterium]
MLDNLFLSSVVEWSRLQFALTAIFHWFFVPFTLGITFMIAIMETIYVKTGNEFWKKTVKFWMTVFGINFAVGVASGLILEFEFGTNWSNYSWFVGDIFGAPLAIEGILAFFMETTFFAVMFFGWNKVGRKTHLAASWLTAFAANLSALWILVANGWMQNPVGMQFNPDTARNEMNNFWEVLFNPTAITKFFHTITSGYVLAAIVVIGISSWFILKGREKLFAQKSILVASVFGLLSSAVLIFTGDSSAHNVAHTQPMKLAAMEGLYKGKEGTGFSMFGILTPGKEHGDGKDAFVFNLEFPKLLSFLGYRNFNAFVPGIDDLIKGGFKENYDSKDGGSSIALSVEEKIRRGKAAIEAYKEYNKAKNEGNEIVAADAKNRLFDNFKYYGYGYFNEPSSIIPNVPLCYYSFRIMVWLGFLFVFIFVLSLWIVVKRDGKFAKWILYLSIWSIPLVYIASQAGWIVAEMGRQPWTVQDLLPTIAAVSRIDSSSVIVTFFLFFVLFTILFIAELKILFSQIKKGPKISNESV